MNELNSSILDKDTKVEPVLEPERQEKARQYAHTNRCLTIAELVLAGIALVLLIFGGFSEKITGYFNLPLVATAAIYIIILIAVYGLISTPISCYRGFVLPRRYGLSNQGFAGWLGDYIKAGILAVILGTGIVAASYWFISTLPQVWWVLAWGLLVLISLILSILMPVVLVPLFYKTKPIEDEALKGRFRRLAEKANADIKDFYTLEFSSKGSTANAAMMGTGKTKRIALSDTLLEGYTPEEIEVIIAHELGHYKNKDFIRLFLFQVVLMFVYFGLTHIITIALVAPLGLGGISDVAALPLMILVFAILSLLLVPFSNAIVRRLEHEADDFALHLTGRPQAFITMMTKLTDQNLAEAEPNRWVERLFSDHPSYNSRLEHARCYLEKPGE